MAVSKMWSVCLFILVVEMMERMTYYTFSGAQRNQLMMWFSSSQSIAINSAFTVMSYAVCIFGGWLADAKLGRYWTIVVFASIYCVGVTMSAAAAWPSFNNEALYLLGVFAFIAVGTGGIKPNISSFGGDQFDVSNPEEAKDQEKFFSYFYMMINVGAAVSYGYLVTLATNGQAPAIPQEYGFFSAYMIAAGCMFIAVIIFLCGTPLYVRKGASGDSLCGAAYYVWHGAKRSAKGAMSLVGWVTAFAFVIFSIASAFAPESMAYPMAYISLSLATTCVVCLCATHLNNDFLNGIPDHPSGMLTLSEAKDFFAVVPTILVANVCFNIVYNNMSGPFTVQACQMNLRVGSSQINGAFFNVADCLAIIICTPILEMFIFPFVARMKGSPVTRNQKLIAGFIMAAGAMAVAAAMEYARQAAVILPLTDPNNISNCAGNPSTNPIPMSDISGFLMFVPFSMVGIAEILINPVLIYFSYDQVPLRVRSLSSAFNMLSTGSISSGFTTCITLLMGDFLGNNDNLNDGGNVQYFYFLGMGVALAGIPLVLLTSSMYVEKSFTDPNSATELRVESTTPGAALSTYTQESGVEKADKAESFMVPGDMGGAKDV